MKDLFFKKLSYFGSIMYHYGFGCFTETQLMKDRVKARRNKLEGFCRDDASCPKGLVFNSENCSDCFSRKRHIPQLRLDAGREADFMEEVFELINCSDFVRRNKFLMMLQMRAQKNRERNPSIKACFISQVPCQMIRNVFKYI